MYTIGICDDAQNICAEIEYMIHGIAQRENISICIKTWKNGEALCDYLEEGSPLDVLFLDIEMMELNGIEVGKYIRNRMDDHRMQIIYISGMQSYAQQLFQFHPLEFLVKPIDEKKLCETLLLALRMLGKREGRLDYSYKGDHYYFDYSKIIYLSSRGREIQLFTIDGEYRFYDKLSSVMERLPSYFWRIHKSFLINTDHVQRFRYDSVELTNGSNLPISKAFRKEVRRKLLGEGEPV